MRSSASPQCDHRRHPTERPPAIATAAVRTTGRPQRREAGSHALERSSRMRPAPRRNGRARGDDNGGNTASLAEHACTRIAHRHRGALVLDEEEPQHLSLDATRRLRSPTRSRIFHHDRHVSEQKDRFGATRPHRGGRRHRTDHGFFPLGRSGQTMLEPEGRRTRTPSTTAPMPPERTDADAGKFAQVTVGYVTWTGPMVWAARR